LDWSAVLDDLKVPPENSLEAPAMKKNFIVPNQ
jgi:hypothetical protein